MTWTDNGDSVRFSYSVHLPSLEARSEPSSTVAIMSNYYISFAFSNDTLMGGDNVVCCKVYEGEGSVQQMYNLGRSRPILIDEANPKIGISNDAISFEDGFLNCAFDRLKSMPNVTKYYDLKNDYYLLLAKGNVVSGINFNFSYIY